jgi:uncharacterized repeat protein (TIGR01451 family)
MNEGQIIVLLVGFLLTVLSTVIGGLILEDLIGSRRPLRSAIQRAWARIVRWCAVPTHKVAVAALAPVAVGLLLVVGLIKPPRVDAAEVCGDAYEAGANGSLWIAAIPDLAIAEEGDTIGYAVIVRNYSDEVQHNVRLYYFPLSNLSYETGSGRVSTVSSAHPTEFTPVSDAWASEEPGSPGLALGNLGPSEFVTVRFSVKVPSVVAANSFAQLKVWTGSDETLYDAAESIASTLIQQGEPPPEPKLCLYKSVDHQEVRSGEELRFTIVIRNEGTLPLDVVWVFDPLAGHNPDDLLLIEGSIFYSYGDSLADDWEPENRDVPFPLSYIAPSGFAFISYSGRLSTPIEPGEARYFYTEVVGDDTAPRLFRWTMIWGAEDAPGVDAPAEPVPATPMP